MKVHEYQAKQVLSKFGVPVSPGTVAYTVDEAEAAAKDLGGNVFAVKAQIHAGGRGKGGGVKIAKSLAEVKEYASQILGMQLVTPQTGAQGQQVNRIYIEKGCAIAQELYVSLLLDRDQGRLTFVASAAGGMEIEEVAETNPEKIIRMTVDPNLGYQDYIGRDLAFALGLEGKTALKCANLVKGLYNAYTHYDASLVEINPLAVTEDGDCIALDAKVDFDDNALYRHPDIEELRDVAEEDPAEHEANKHDLSYIKLDGNIGCMVNGAGLAMATMDVIKLHGGEPANFLDVGGGAPRERVTTAFKLILSDSNVEGILVNIFGGIMRCDIIAEGVIAAAKDVGINVPLVVRLEGTNVNQGKEILKNSGLDIITADDLGEAAEKIVQSVKEAA